eukprot:1356322-Pyramimonas_sp.AAC.1
MGNDSLCYLCKPPVVLPLCSTDACNNIVHTAGDTHCSLCITSCPPCTNGLRCHGRTAPGQRGLCRGCLSSPASSPGATAAPPGKPPPLVEKCAFSTRGCSNLKSAASDLCETCCLRGAPCASAPHGCLNRVRLDQPSDFCSACSHGRVPCRGPRGKGCANPSRKT